MISEVRNPNLPTSAKNSSFLSGVKYLSFNVKINQTLSPSLKQITTNTLFSSSVNTLEYPIGSKIIYRMQKFSLEIVIIRLLNLKLELATYKLKGLN